MMKKATIELTEEIGMYDLIEEMLETTIGDHKDNKWKIEESLGGAKLLSK